MPSSNVHPHTDAAVTLDFRSFLGRQVPSLDLPVHHAQGTGRIRGLTPLANSQRARLVEVASGETRKLGCTALEIRLPGASVRGLAVSVVARGEEQPPSRDGSTSVAALGDTELWVRTCLRSPPRRTAGSTARRRRTTSGRLRLSSKCRWWSRPCPPTPRGR
jgi:hypothetical protein